jgi:alcohol dehydrogenase YqhD (iron-dependent ADH family)
MSSSLGAFQLPAVQRSAKAIAAGVRFAGDVWELFEHRGTNIASAEPVYVVLTLSASGSERNGGAVAQDDAAGTKWSIRSDALFPRLSFVDPAHQRHLPWSQTTNGASDAVAHVLEHCVNSVDGRAEAVTLAVNEALVRQIVLATDRLQATPTDLLARTNLCLATTLALDGTSGIGMHGGAWHVRTLEHAVSALRPTVAHGAGLGVTFAAYIKHMHDAHPAGALRQVTVTPANSQLPPLLSRCSPTLLLPPNVSSREVRNQLAESKMDVHS